MGREFLCFWNCKLFGLFHISKNNYILQIDEYAYFNAIILLIINIFLIYEYYVNDLLKVENCKFSYVFICDIFSMILVFFYWIFKIKKQMIIVFAQFTTLISIYHINRNITFLLLVCYISEFKIKHNDRLQNWVNSNDKNS